MSISLRVFRVMARRLVVCSLLVAILGSAPTTLRSQDAEPAKVEPNTLVIELFARTDSEQCDRAEKFLTEQMGQREGVELRVYDVAKDRDALVRLNKLSKRYGYEKPGVPSVFVSNSLFVGFRDAKTTGHDIEKRLKIRAYVRTGCKHCQAAKRFLDDLQERWPALTIEYFDVVSDVNARNEVAELARLYRVRVASFPCIEIAGRLITGYQDDETTGKQIENYFLNPGADELKEKAEAKRKRDDGESPKRSDTIRQHGMRAISPALELNSLVRVALACSVSGAMNLDFNPRKTRYGYLGPALVAYLPAPQNEKNTPAKENDSVIDSSEGILLPEEVILPDEVILPEEADGSSIRDGPAFRDAPVGDEGSEEQAINAPFFGRLRVSELGMVTFTFMIGLVDGFNPCAMWVLVFLLSVLVNIKDRKKIIVIAGTFVVVSGLAYFAFMAAWFNVFQLVGFLRPVQIGLGLMAIIVGAVNVKDFFALHKGISFSIPDSAKPGIYRRVRKIVSAKNMTVALSGAIVLAVIVNIVELLCTAGLPALYTEILTLQDLPMWTEYAYLGLYIVAYMLDDAVLVTIVVCTLSHRKMQEVEGRWLKLLSGLVILLLGTVMIFKPDWLV